MADVVRRATGFRRWTAGAAAAALGRTLFIFRKSAKLKASKFTRAGRQIRFCMCMCIIGIKGDLNRLQSQPMTETRDWAALHGIARQKPKREELAIPAWTFLGFQIVFENLYARN